MADVSHKIPILHLWNASQKTAKVELNYPGGTDMVDQMIVF
jgi:hypothetical protein